MASLIARVLTSVLCALVFLIDSTAAQASFTPVLPPSYPLAVRNPYLSTWLPGNEVANLPSSVAQFWNGQQLTWSVIARIDGQTYSLFGVPRPGDRIQPGNLTSADFTATHSTFTLAVEQVEFVLDFFSPVSPHNYSRQSMPYSYLTVSTRSRSSETPSVQVYSDIDNSWLGQFGVDVQLDSSFLGSREAHVSTFSPVGSDRFTESGEMALWGTAVYCTRENASKLSKTIGISEAVRDSFAANGSLEDDKDLRPGSVIAFSHELGPLEGTSNVTFVIGHVRNESVVYLGDDRSNYFRSVCEDTGCGCMHALDDLHAADEESRSLDAFIAGVQTGGANYSKILALSTRQVFGTMELTIPSDSLDTNSVLSFVKEISSNGNVNTVDVIMPMAPIFYVLAPDYIRLLLHPVLHYLDSGAWPHDYTIHDMGKNYPNATGHDDGKAEEMPVEESGNLLALMYMYERASGVTSYKEQFSGILKTYADYLVNNGLYTEKQFSTDDGAGVSANQTGLAVKSAIGLNAYGVMTNQAEYSAAGKRFADVLYNQSVGTDAERTHFTMFLDDDETWAIQFNLYLDVLLELNTFPVEAYRMQTDFYPSARREAGVPLDSRDVWTKTDWMIFAAATAMAPGAENEEVRDMFIDDVHAYMTNGKNHVPFGDRFYTATQTDGNGNSHDVGSWDIYKARPVAGGHFALLALDGPDQFAWGR